MTRVRVTAPASARARRNGMLPAARTSADARDAAQESDAGQVFIRSLIRSQLRLGLVVAGGFLLILLAFPLMLGAGSRAGALDDCGPAIRLGAPGAGIYPVIGLSAWLYVRTAARNEARYRDLAGDK